jgi:hypothetical protein
MDGKQFEQSSFSMRFKSVRQLIASTALLQRKARRQFILHSQQIVVGFHDMKRGLIINVSDWTSPR